MPARLLVVMLLLTALVVPACTLQEPDVVPNEQVAAADRTEETPTDEPADDEGGGGGGSLEFVAIDIAWDSAPSEAPAGPNTFTLINEGGSVHNLLIDEVSSEPIVEAQGGQTVEGEAELEPGDYVFYCNVPGHREAGMEGNLTVS